MGKSEVTENQIINCENKILDGLIRNEVQRDERIFEKGRESPFSGT